MKDNINTNNNNNNNTNTPAKKLVDNFINHNSASRANKTICNLTRKQKLLNTGKNKPIPK